MADPGEGDQPEQDFNEWNLEAGAEFRFELEQGVSLAIKVSAGYEGVPICGLIFRLSSSRARQKYSAQN